MRLLISLEQLPADGDSYGVASNNIVFQQVMEMMKDFKAVFCR